MNTQVFIVSKFWYDSHFKLLPLFWYRAYLVYSTSHASHYQNLVSATKEITKVIFPRSLNLAKSYLVLKLNSKSLVWMRVEWYKWFRTHTFKLTCSSAFASGAGIALLRWLCIRDLFAASTFPLPSILLCLHTPDKFRIIITRNDGYFTSKTHKLIPAHCLFALLILNLLIYA